MLEVLLYLVLTGQLIKYTSSTYTTACALILSHIQPLSNLCPSSSDFIEHLGLGPYIIIAVPMSINMYNGPHVLSC